MMIATCHRDISNASIGLFKMIVFKHKWGLIQRSYLEYLGIMSLLCRGSLFHLRNPSLPQIRHLDGPRGEQQPQVSHQACELNVFMTLNQESLCARSQSELKCGMHQWCFRSLAILWELVVHGKDSPCTLLKHISSNIFLEHILWQHVARLQKDVGEFCDKWRVWDKFNTFAEAIQGNSSISRPGQPGGTPARGVLRAEGLTSLPNATQAEFWIARAAAISDAGNAKVSNDWARSLPLSLPSGFLGSLFSWRISPMPAWLSMSLWYICLTLFSFKTQLAVLFCLLVCDSAPSQCSGNRVELNELKDRQHDGLLAENKNDKSYYETASPNSHSWLSPSLEKHCEIVSGPRNSLNGSVQFDLSVVYGCRVHLRSWKRDWRGEPSQLLVCDGGFQIIFELALL